MNSKRKAGFEISLLSDPVKQITPNNSMYYLNKLNKKINVLGYALYGDIYIKSNYKVFGIEISKKISIGDGIVFSSSASDLSTTNQQLSQSYASEINMDVGVISSLTGYDLNFEMPDISSMSYSHIRLPLQNKVIDDVINILSDE